MRAIGDAAGEVRSAPLPDGGRLVVRRARVDDADALYSFYEQLPTTDLQRRFFTPRPPTRTLVEEWVDPTRGGRAVLVEMVPDNGEPELIGEAGYSLLPDGDGELAITIAPGHRGWVGSWVLDALLDEAAAAGVPNLHADVLLLNRPMVSVLRHRRAATVDHPDLGMVRLVVATADELPGWSPTRSRPRVLVEGVRGMWWGEGYARDAGLELRMCPGPGDDLERCPVIRGEECPMVADADVVVTQFGSPLDTRLAEAHRCMHPGLTVVVPEPEFDIGGDGADFVDRIAEAAAANDHRTG